MLLQVQRLQVESMNVQAWYTASKIFGGMLAATFKFDAPPDDEKSNFTANLKDAEVKVTEYEDAGQG